MMHDLIAPAGLTMSPDAFRLDNRVALVTGSSAGIGHALAKGLAEAGAIVVMNGRDAGRLAAASEAIRGPRVDVREAVFDVTDRPAVEAAVDRIERDIGPIEVLINNAGLQRRAPLEDFTDESWHEVTRTNLGSPFIVGQTVARRMIPRKRGSIINICSVNSELARPTIAPYTATKGGLKMLTKGMAVDWGKHGIRVNGLGPGYFKTELNKALYTNPEFSGWLEGRTPLGRWGNVEELAGAAVFLASDAASFVTGHILYVDGGVTAAL
jgi:gluconate 5-dehydrogenase